MSIQPNPIGSVTGASQIAGVSRAVRKGGEADKQASDLAAKQASASNPGGNQPDVSEVGASEEMGDRGGDGRQTLDEFQSAQDQEQSPANEENTADETPSVDNPSDGSSGDSFGDSHVDFQA